MTLRIFGAVTTLLALGLTACGQRSEEPPVAANGPVEPPAEPLSVQRTPSPEGARLFFITPEDGDTVSNPINIEFGIDGMDVVKAGNDQANSGHHHLLIDTDLPDLSGPIPADSQHVHFGDGSTKTEITLPPGQHTLCMLLGDHRHFPHDPPVISDAITITVE